MVTLAIYICLGPCEGPLRWPTQGLPAMMWRAAPRLLLFALARSALPHVALSMFSKRSRGDQPEQAAPAKRLRGNIADLFLSSQVSGERAVTLAKDAVEPAAGKHLRDLARVRLGGHASRYLLRKFARKSAWPLIYEHEVRALDREDHEVLEKVPFLPIHEILAELARFSDLDSLTCTDGVELRSQTHFGNALR